AIRSHQRYRLLSEQCADGSIQLDDGGAQDLCRPGLRAKRLYTVFRTHRAHHGTRRQRGERAGGSHIEIGISGSVGNVSSLFDVIAGGFRGKCAVPEGIESGSTVVRREVVLQLREVDQAVLDVILVLPRVTCVALDVPGRVDLVMDTEGDLP